MVENPTRWRGHRPQRSGPLFSCPKYCVGRAARWTNSPNSRSRSGRVRERKVVPYQHTVPTAIRLLHFPIHAGSSQAIIPRTAASSIVAMNRLRSVNRNGLWSWRGIKGDVRQSSQRSFDAILSSTTAAQESQDESNRNPTRQTVPQGAPFRVARKQIMSILRRCPE
jgi:hypothetical protein